MSSTGVGRVSAARAVGLLLGVMADSMVGGSVREGADSALAEVAKTIERRLYADHPVPGAVHTGVLVGGVVGAGALIERLGRRRPLLGAVTTAVGTWAVLGGARIAVDGTTLARHLETGDVAATRETLARWDSRCAHDLDSTALARASVEVVAQNSSDTVVAPLLWGAVAGVPGLVGFHALRVVRRLVADSVPRYHRFGWVASRLDDLANLVPTRAAAALTVAGAPVVGGSAGAAWQAWRRDTVLHPSPNAGRVEAAFAGALEIRLGGRTAYPHGVQELPVLGDGRNPDAGHVTRAVELSRIVGWLAGATSVTLALVVRGVPQLRRSRRRAG